LAGMKISSGSSKPSSNSHFCEWKSCETAQKILDPQQQCSERRSCCSVLCRTVDDLASG
jgi:hypothetical protein